MKQARQWFTGLLLLILALLLSAIGATAQDEQVVVIGHAESTDSLDPARGYTGTTAIVHRAIYETLVTFPDADASAIEPRLATSWTISEDGLVYTFTLNPAAVFSDGSPVEASDVVFSFNRLKNVQGNPSFLADPIASIEAPDAGTVVITLSAIRPSFLAELTNNAFSVSNAEVVQANGGTDAADAATADAAGAWLDANSAGSGPYILEEWDKTVRTVLVRNPNYYGEAPFFDRVIIANIPESAAQKIALESGEIDVALEITADQVGDMESNADISLFKSPGLAVHFIIMNQDESIGGPVSNPLVQRAIRLALDYSGYLDLWGGVTPGSNLAVGLLGAYSSLDGTAVTRDLDAARALLAEAGYPDGFEITLEYPDFTWQGVNMNTNAQKIQADLAEVGITVTLQPGELQVALERYRAGEAGFGYWFWGPDILDPLDLLAFLPGGKVATERAKWLTENASADLLDLINQASLATEATARVEIFGQLQRYMQENAPFAPFVQPDLTVATRASVAGYVWHPQWALDVALLSRAG
ncbi:MAG: ABC transporter substrate-binding protein [Anaerolineae bacterium]|jgi:peptide/nickel transport system substrate-binding protein|nr:ABC transporter substrate-binding protein [Anaerolineae bacterium]